MNDQLFSPDGSIRVDWSVNTGRMSHEIWSPAIYEAATGKLIADLQDGDLDAAFTWLEHGTFRFVLRRYSRQGQISVWMDLPNRRFRIDNGEVEPLESAEQRILKAFPG